MSADTFPQSELARFNPREQKFIREAAIAVNLWESDHLIPPSWKISADPQKEEFRLKEVATFLHQNGIGLEHAVDSKDRMNVYTPYPYTRPLPPRSRRETLRRAAEALRDAKEFLKDNPR